MRRLILTLFVGVGFFLAACNQTTAPARWNDLPVSERATIFGTLTAELGGPMAMELYEIRFRNLQTKEKASLTLNAGLLLFPGVRTASGDAELQESGRSMGRSFELTLPAGQYEFYEVWCRGPPGSFPSDYKSENFSMPFSVEAGKTYYLGELRAYPLQYKDLLGFSTPYGGYFVLRDSRERDTALWLKKRTDGNLPAIENLLLDASKGGRGIRTKPSALY